jgi:cyclopropane-fatty-acyl-phospholipid synthase
MAGGGPESWSLSFAERGLLPDWLVRIGIRRLNRRRLAEEGRGGVEAQRARLLDWVRTLRQGPVAVATDAANVQHYEVPPAFFEKVLGRRLKYSSGLWSEGVRDLDEAEEAMLALTAERARLADGQEILELGCGWGSLTLWMAERFPRSRILAVSNSGDQRAFIEARARARGLGNVEVLTRNAVDFDTDRRFDRVVSVEMLEHMRNYEVLLGRIAGWLRPGGLLFVHIFTHRAFAYPFEDREASDWMAREFFTGGQGLVPWIQALVAARARGGAIEEGMERGAAALVAAGVAAVGDVTNGLTSGRPLARAGLVGTLFHEVYGFTEARAEEALRLAREARGRLGHPGPGLRVAPSPHAVYSTHPATAAALLAAGPASIHLAEVPEERWFVNGSHYQRTAEAWLANLDRRREEILPVLAATYGSEQARRRLALWRIFFLACSELWGYAGGEEWIVSHYLFERRAA